MFNSHSDQWSSETAFQGISRYCKNVSHCNTPMTSFAESNDEDSALHRKTAGQREKKDSLLLFICTTYDITYTRNVRLSNIYLNQINIIRLSTYSVIVDSLSFISRRFFNIISNDSFFILMLIALLTFSPFLDVELSSVVIKDTIAKGSWTYQMF